jgi:hypothetical protein
MIKPWARKAGLKFNEIHELLPYDVSAGSMLVWVFYDLYVWATHALYTHGQYCWLLIKVDSKKVPAPPPPLYMLIVKVDLS